MSAADFVWVIVAVLFAAHAIWTIAIYGWQFYLYLILIAFGILAAVFIVVLMMQMIVQDLWPWDPGFWE